MDRRELYEKLYFHEIDQRNNLHARLDFPLAIIVALIGFLGFLLQSSTHTLYENFLGAAFWLFWVGAFVALVFSIYFFIRSAWGNTYTILATAKENEKYYQDLFDLYQKKNSKKKALKKANQDLESYIYKQFEECSSSNALINDQRSLWIFQCIKSLIFAIFFSVASFGSYFFLTQKTINKNQPLETITINYQNITGTKMTDKNKQKPIKNHSPSQQPVAPLPRKVIEDVSPTKQSDRIINEKNNG